MNIRADDVVDKNRKMLLALMWNTIIAANHNDGLGGGVKRHASSAREMMDKLLVKIQTDLEPYPDGLADSVKNYTKCWQDGKILAGLLHRYGFWNGPGSSWDEIRDLDPEVRVREAVKHM